MPFYEQDLLEETKAILFNLYREYLASSKMRDKIIQYQKEEFNNLEKIKKDKYRYDDLFNKKPIQEITRDDEVSMMKHKDSILEKIFKKIKMLLWKIKKN